MSTYEMLAYLAPLALSAILAAVLLFRGYSLSSTFRFYLCVFLILSLSFYIISVVENTDADISKFALYCRRFVYVMVLILVYWFDKIFKEHRYFRNKTANLKEHASRVEDDSQRRYLELLDRCSATQAELESIKKNAVVCKSCGEINFYYGANCQNCGALLVQRIKVDPSRHCEE